MAFDPGQLYNNPYMQLGAGLLMGAAPGGTFAGGLNLGLHNLQNMQRQQQATAMLGLQIQAMQAKRMEEERKRAAIELVSKTDPNAAAYMAAGFAPQKPAGPESAIGKLQADLAAGRITPDQYSTGLAILSKPLTSTQNIIGGPGGFKVPEGYMLKDPSNPQAGVVPIPGATHDVQTPEQASKTQMLRGAQSRLPEIEPLLFDSNGNVNRENVVTSRLLAGGAIPNTEGDKLATYYEEGIQAITRTETGAAMQQSELNNARTRFQPKMRDSDEVIKIKWNMYSDFLNGTLKLIDPQGRFMTERFDAELEQRKSAAVAPPPWATPENVVVP